MNKYLYLHEKSEANNGEGALENLAAGSRNETRRLYTSKWDYCEFAYLLNINITSIKDNIIEYCINLNYA